MFGVKKKQVKEIVTNCDELKEALAKANVSESHFSLDVAKNFDDEYVLVHKNSQWVVIFYERGSGHPQSFNDERSACNYIYYRLVN